MCGVCGGVGEVLFGAVIVDDDDVVCGWLRCAAGPESCLGRVGGFGDASGHSGVG